MSEDRSADAVQRLLRLVAAKLEEYLDGDELALETLGEALEAEGCSPDDLQSAVLAIRSLAGGAGGTGWIAGPPGRHAHRVLSTEERESLSTEAWGYLLDLRTRGTLDSEQFERVLDALVGSGVRPVDVELARDVASRVALEMDGEEFPGDRAYGDAEVAH